jgi:xanthine dehydrogenase YagR molybdenum-binding subunit
MFTLSGNMPATVQRVALGAAANGTLTALVQDSINTTGFNAARPEPVTRGAQALYAVPNLHTRIRVARVNVGMSTFMRTPGDTPGQFAIESAMDELAHELGIDPVELRRANYSGRHPQSGLPWGGNHLLRCYEIGERVFGWSRRSARPGTMRDGNDLIGYGMATGFHAESSNTASAQVDLAQDGHAVVRTGTQEIGGGTLTTLVQIAASRMGLSPDVIRIEAGDTNLPPGAPSFSSLTSGSTGSAVHLAAGQVRDVAIRLAVADAGSPLYGLSPGEVTAQGGRLVERANPARGETYPQLLRRNGIGMLRERGDYQPPAEDDATYALGCFAAHFVEVRIDRRLRRVRVARHVGVYDIGRVLNLKTATNQARGGMIFALGSALMERFEPDPVTGLALAPALTDYHVPVHADVGAVTPLFIDEPETNAHPSGAKGLGEICTIGVNAAIANAVFNATGVRVRDLPITPEKLAAGHA